MSVMSEFWWRNGRDSRGMHWKSWESLCKPKECGGLGFKDLEAYNLALLGRQLWRMIKNPQSLMAKVFKSRYFKASNPLNAPLGTRPSFSWRSIHTAQKLIQQGARVVIGNGKNTRVWSERWLGASPATMVQSMRIGAQQRNENWSDDMRVSELLISNGREWNMEMLNVLFTEEVKHSIISIRPAGTNSKDTYVWEFTKTGHYTVKSGYWVQTSILALPKDQQAVVQPSLDSIYQMVWRLETSPKIKHFLWRCLNNALPVAENMTYRHIGKEKSCCRCGGEAESVNHLLFQCHYARMIWAVANVHIPPAGHWSDSLYTNLYWVLNLKKEYPQEEVEEGFVPELLWRLWKNRNELLFRGTDYDAISTIQKSWDGVWERRNRDEVIKEEVKVTTIEEPEKKWTPPAPASLKCNTDASWSKETMIGGVGWILRDHQGLLLWAGARKLPMMRSVIETEAEAISWAIQTLVGFGYKTVIIETDSLVLARMLNGEEEVWPVLEPILQGITSSLAVNAGYKMVYYPRSGNKSADRIAKETSTFTSFVPKLYSMVPMWLNSCFEADKPFVRN